jgi:NADH-quinone oxidoreductase subunit C
MTDTTTDTETEVPEAPPVDEARQPVLDALTAALGDDLVGSEIDKGDLWVRVNRSAWKQAAEVLKHQLGFHYFCFLSGIDWMPAPGLSGEKSFEPAEGAVVTEDTSDEVDNETALDDDTPTTMTTGVAGGDTRFQVLARLYNVDTHVGITLKADLDDANPEIDSWVEFFRGADWHERETWEMYGFNFVGHPGLRHLYLPSEFEGFPLRKDFPLLAREVKPWPGLVDVEPIPGGGDEEESETAEVAE